MSSAASSSLVELPPAANGRDKFDRSLSLAAVLGSYSSRND
jgi:hypothetical protein